MVFEDSGAFMKCEIKVYRIDKKFIEISVLDIDKNVEMKIAMEGKWLLDAIKSLGFSDEEDCDSEIPLKIYSPQFNELEKRVKEIEHQFHDMAEKMWTRIEIIEEKIRSRNE